MIGILLCVFAFWVTYARTRRSVGAGFLALLAFGYGYGLIRARIADVGSHFVFDAALFGLYAAAFSTPPSEEGRLRSQTARAWTLALAGWPLVCMAYSPLIPDAQPLVVQLVGLRDGVLMLPCLILGARLKRADLDALAPGLAVLNLIALGFAGLEYVYGIEAFIPRAAVTDIVYLSRDIQGASDTFYRIPSTFPHAHAYGGTMALSVPFIAHGLESGRRVRMLCWTGLGAAFLGTFLCGARLPVVTLALATIYALGSLRMRSSTVLAFALTAIAAAYLVANLERFQRFTTLGDTDMVRERIGQGLNMSFFDVLAAYPIGAGLASAFGTSIPYFLSDTRGIHAQFGLESEYGRLLLEEGIFGLALWTSFILFSTFRRQKAHEASPTAAAYMQALVAISWLTGLIGCGLLSSIPSTALLLTAMGLRLTSPAVARTARSLRHVGARPRRLAGRTTAAAALAVEHSSR